MKHPLQPGPRRGVTLTELLVVMVIVSLLATIAVPVYVTKAEQARIAVANQEVRQLADAEEACAIAHQFYVPLQMLDDNIETQYSESDPFSDDLGKEDGADALYLIYATRDVWAQKGNQAIMSVGAGSPHYVAVNKLKTTWQGPFINFNRCAFQEEVRSGSGTAYAGFVRWDFPLDPWGNPYRLYSPIGVVGSNAFGNYLTAYTDLSDGEFHTTQDNRFDRFAVVSFGPNGLTYPSPGATSTADDDDDDIICLFGGVFTETAFRAFP